jgi:hypothetical protein
LAAPTLNALAARGTTREDSPMKPMKQHGWFPLSHAETGAGIARE